MTSNVDLLPLPKPGMLHVGEPSEWFTADQMQSYARANVAHAVAPLWAEIDALRTRLEDTVRDSTNKIEALRAEVEDYRTNGAAAVRFAPNSAYWSNELRRLFGDDARSGIDVLENQYRQELARAERLEEQKKLHVGNLPSLTDSEYPGLGNWWVQLWNGDEVFARAFGASPEEARHRAEHIRDALFQQSTPSAPVEMKDEPIDASDNAEYIERCADKLERCGLRVTAGALRVIAHEHRTLAQQLTPPSAPVGTKTLSEFMDEQKALHPGIHDKVQAAADELRASLAQQPASSAPVGVEAIAAEIRASLDRDVTASTRRRWAIELEALAQQPAAAHEPCAAVAAIQFALTDPEGMTFLRLWNEGDFDTLRREWPDALRKIYVGADPSLTQHQEPT